MVSYHLNQNQGTMGFFFLSNNPESFLTKRSIEIVKDIIKRFQQILKVKIPTSENVKKCLKSFVCKFYSYNWNILEMTFRLIESHLHNYFQL